MVRKILIWVIIAAFTLFVLFWVSPSPLHFWAGVLAILIVLLIMRILTSKVKGGTISYDELKYPNQPPKGEIQEDSDAPKRFNSGTEGGNGVGRDGLPGEGRLYATRDFRNPPIQEYSNRGFSGNRDERTDQRKYPDESIERGVGEEDSFIGDGTGEISRARTGEGRNRISETSLEGDRTLVHRPKKKFSWD